MTAPHTCAWPHGTRQRYQCAHCRCRCADCTLGNTLYQRGYRARWSTARTAGGSAVRYRQLELLRR